MQSIRIAVPLADGALSQHFGHSEQFAFFTRDKDAHRVLKAELLPAPVGGHGSLPAWIKAHGASVVLAGHIGAGAQDGLAAAGCTLVAGAPDLAPQDLAQAYLDGRLQGGEAAGCCGHDEGNAHGGCGCGH